MPPRRKKKAEPRSRGLTAAEVREGRPSAAASALAAAIEELGSAKKFKAEGVKPEQLARAGGAAEE